MSNYSILRRKRADRADNIRVVAHLPQDLDKFSKQPIALDLETHGIDPDVGSIRSIAIANDYGSVAIDLEALSPTDRMTLTKWIMRQKIVAHNAVFDCDWLYTKTGMMPNIEACTLVMFKQLATEGFLGQRWGLKTAMVDILGWKDSNEADLYAWLKEHKLSAADMAQAPWDILGKYNALDALAAWQLYKYFLELIKKNNWEDAILQYHREDTVNLIELSIEQRLNGMTIDLEKLNNYDESLTVQIEDKRKEFLELEDVKPHVQYYQAVIVEEILVKQPPQFTKTGEVTARYKNWEAKVEQAKNSIDFNIDSGQQLQWLIYDRMMFKCPIKTDKGATSVGKKALPYLGHIGKLLKEYRVLRDRRKFVTALKNTTRDGVLHPRIKVHAALTGRSGGGVEE